MESITSQSNMMELEAEQVSHENFFFMKARVVSSFNP